MRWKIANAHTMFDERADHADVRLNLQRQKKVKLAEFSRAQCHLVSLLVVLAF